MEDVTSDVIRAKRLRHYLRGYWVKPSHKYDALGSEVVSRPGYYVVDCPTKADQVQVGVSTILAYNDFIWWESDFAYVWLERYMSNETLTADLLEPRLIIAVFTGQEIQNKLLVPFINQMGGMRETSGLSTLVCCLSPQPSLNGRRFQSQSKGGGVVI